jgi:hypothetical protein
MDDRTRVEAAIIRLEQLRMDMNAVDISIQTLIKAMLEHVMPNEKQETTSTDRPNTGGNAGESGSGCAPSAGAVAVELK